MITLKLPVLWGHMDAMGHVNNTIYFRYFESARVEYMEKMGLFCDPDEPIFPILASTKCDYKVPLTYPDEIIVTAKTIKVGRTSFTQAYEITSTAQNCVSAVGEGIVVCVDRKTGKPVPVPQDIRAKIERAESAALPPPLSRDTDPRAEAVQMNILRRMSSAEKFALVKDANRCTEELMMAGLRMRHPEAGPAELRRRLLGLMLGEELARKAFGPLDQSLA